MGDSFILGVDRLTYESGDRNKSGVTGEIHGAV